ncbi:MAG: SCP2 sterol-binding domain-containing protein [Acidimicrobiia bacterium]|nr:SCP2 sterol-binding domain-containing protein [Acidimicrobiia bacterium]
MVGFLTPAWAAELTAVLESNDSFRAAAGDADLRVRYDVWGGPQGDVTWLLHLNASAPSVSLQAGGPHAATADVTVTMPWDVAVSLVAGRTTLRRAEAEGSLGITGDLAGFYRHNAALACFDQLHTEMDVEFRS